jgi:hypothetical protein
MNGGNGGDGEALASFFKALADDPGLYNDYFTNPLETMRKRGLSEEVIGAVLQGDLHHLNRLLRDQDTAFILGTLIRW